jgi:hypothetical protein
MWNAQIYCMNNMQVSVFNMALLIPTIIPGLLDLLYGAGNFTGLHSDNTEFITQTKK